MAFALAMVLVLAAAAWFVYVRLESIDVSDRGKGFPADLAARAFEHFARGDAARIRGGAGLGLAIAAAIAEAHDGTASIAASGGGRTTVRLSVRLRGKPA